ncbi:ras guanine nucleotide exchange factor i-related [Anaeramoeba flamelloides]|uniref:Ras guanine nucleotide exchange factor i-related n=1 Tax=Anaeramoeba flamelloides TaxID=1746091 RepID=A0ABQ8YR77_9EUKA|nr:ras guanine nucleotide exchange factor i-related [Anaeramoeba flamelloides]
MSLKIGDRVEIFGNLGTIKFIGTTLFSLERKWVGISLDKPIGKHDGTIDNQSYFHCEPNHGIFVRPSLVKCISTSDPELSSKEDQQSNEKENEKEKEKENKIPKENDTTNNKNNEEKKNEKEEEESENEDKVPLLKRSLPFVEEIHQDFYLQKDSEILLKLEDHMTLFSSVIDEKEVFQLEIDELEELINDIEEINLEEYEEEINKKVDPEIDQRIQKSLKEITTLTEKSTKLRKKYTEIKEKIEDETKEQLQKTIDLTQIEIENYKDYIQKEKSKKKKLKQEILSAEMELKVINENTLQIKSHWNQNFLEREKEIKFEDLKIDELLEECERIQHIPFETLKIFPPRILKIQQQNEKLQNEIFKFQNGMSLTQIKANEVLIPYDSIDRSQWVKKIMKQHPEIKEIRERVNPKERTLLFSQLYAKEKREVDRQLTKELINTLIIQHFESMKQPEIVEIVSKLTSNRKIEGENRASILRNIFKRAELDTEKLYDLTIRQPKKNQKKSKNKNQSKEEFDDEDSISLFKENSKKMGLRFKIQDDFSIWDEPADNPNNIRFEEKKNESIEENILGTLLCANINKLIERLTWEKSLDSNYTRAFLMTYQSFMSAEHLLYKLIERYRVVKKNEQDKAEFEKNRIRIQIRVISVLKQWLRDPAEFDDELLSDIDSFIGREIMITHPGSAKTLLKLVSKLQLKQSLQLKMEVTQKNIPPEPKIPKKIFSSNLKLWDVCAEEAARQITIHVSKLFTQIHAFELTTQAWNKPKLKHKAINVLKLIYKFNDLVSYYIEKILECEGLTERSEVIEKLIEMGDFFLRFNNFDCLIGIISAISCSPINRLKFTKEEVSSRSWDIFEELEDVTSEDHSYRNYRDALTQAENPVIPYIGMYLTDLTFILDGNPDNIDGLINFAKRKMLFLTIDKIQSFQMGCYYNFIEIAQIQNLIGSVTPKKTENQYYDISLLREPRGCDRSDLKL